MPRYLLAEYGSWGVMLIAFASGLAVGRSAGIGSLIALLSVSLLVNSKQAFTVWLRSGSEGGRTARNLFIFQVLVGSVMIIWVAGPSIRAFMPYSALPILYLALFLRAGEHALPTETAGFMLLSLSALIGKYTATGAVDGRFYLAAAVFFTAGVFKVRLQFTKRQVFRTALVLYVGCSVLVYSAAGLPIGMLFPLVDNLVFAVTLYSVRLQTTGWIEVAKGIMFLMLATLLY